MRRNRSMAFFEPTPRPRFPCLVSEEAVEPVEEGGAASDEVLADRHEPPQLTPFGGGLMSPGKLAVEVLALEAGGVEGVGLAAFGLRRKGPLKDIGQHELDAALGGEPLHAGPTGGAFLDPDGASAAGVGFFGGGGHDGVKHAGVGGDFADGVLACGEVASADDTVLIVIVDGEHDILRRHGRFPSTGGFGRRWIATRQRFRARLLDPPGNRPSSWHLQALR